MRGRRRTGKRVSNSAVDLGDVQSRLRTLERICKDRKRGPGTPEYSLKCRLAALNGNWPRIKRETWESVCADYAKVVSGVAPTAKPKPVKCELCLTEILEPTVVNGDCKVCRLCAEKFWSDSR